MQTRTRAGQTVLISHDGPVSGADFDNEYHWLDWIFDREHEIIPDCLFCEREWRCNW